MTTPNIALMQHLGSGPLFMYEGSIASVANALSAMPKNQESDDIDFAEMRQPVFRAKWYRHPTYSHVAVLPVTDVLYHGDRDYYYGQSYEGVKANISDINADESITAIAKPTHCFGGTAAGCGSTEKWIANNQQKPIFSLVNEASYSASMYIDAPSHHIGILPSAGIGSIGTVIPFMEFSQYFENLGINVDIIRSGEKKYRGNDMEPLSEEARAEMQADVDLLATQFIQAVAEHRGLSADQVRSYEAGTFMGEAPGQMNAVDAGLADAVYQTPEEFYRHVAESVSPPTTSSIFLPNQEHSMPGSTKPTGSAGNDNQKQYTEEEVQARIDAATAKAEKEAETKLIAKQEQKRKDDEAEQLRIDKEARDRKDAIEASDAYSGRSEQAKAYIDGDLADVPADKAIAALGNAPLDPVKRSNLGKELENNNVDIAPNANNDTNTDDEFEEMVQFRMAHGETESEARSFVTQYREREDRSPSQTAAVPFR